MNKEQISEWLDKYEIKDYLINDDLTVDVNGHVSLGFSQLDSIPVQFNKVTGDFTCIGNFLKSLNGSPVIVEGHYSCSENTELISLEGAPKTVNKNFICTNNNLKSLKGAPEEIGGNFLCFNNIELNSLDYISPTIGGRIICGNTAIKSIENFNCKFGQEFIHYGTPIENFKELYELENEKLTVRLSYNDFCNALHYNKLNNLIPNKITKNTGKIKI